MKKLVSLMLTMLVLLSMAAPGVTAVAEASWDSPDISWKQDTSPVTFSLFLDIPWAPMDVWGTDHVSQRITELTGVSFEVTKAQDTNHLDMLMASGEYPDAIFTFRNKHKYEDASISQPWNVLIPEYCPELLDLTDDSAIAATTKDDGNFYTLYTHLRDDAYWADPTAPVSYGEADIMMRDDIMAELGNPTVESFDDFYNVLVTVKEKYPDYTPYMRSATGTNGEALMTWLGVDFRSSDFAADENGQLSMTIRNREIVEEYLAFENKLIREGLMSVEGLTYDFEKQKQAVLAGKVFCVAAQIYDVDLFNAELAATGNPARYTALDKPLTVDGEIKYSPVNASPGFAGLYITTACKDPGRLIRLIEFMRSPEGDRLTQWGVEGLDYTLNEDGLPIINTDLEWKVRGDNVWYFGASFMVELEKAMIPANPEFSQVSKLMYDFKPYWRNNLLLSKCTPFPETPESEIKTSASQLWETNRDMIVTAASDEEFTARMDAFYTDLERLDLDSYVAWAQVRYDAAAAQAK